MPRATLFALAPLPEVSGRPEGVKRCEVVVCVCIELQSEQMLTDLKYDRPKQDVNL